MREKTFACGLEAVLAILGGKWKPLIVYHLASGSKRTGQLCRLVTGVSEKMLIQHLKELTDDGVIRRIDFQAMPPHVEYELTDFGQCPEAFKLGTLQQVSGKFTCSHAPKQIAG